MSKSITKAGIIAALADETGLSRADVGRVLANLAEMTYREAANGFTIPGLCKFKLVRRKESRRFNPVTRTRFLVAAHDILKVIPLKKAREKIAPLPENLLVREIPSEPAVEKEAAKPDTAASEAAPATAAAAAPAEPALAESGGIIFACPHCGNTIMAQLSERGQTAECPVCNGQMVVPDAAAAPAVAPAAAKPKTVSNFVTFVCEVCKQEIEAPLEMIGMNAVCPACGSQLKVPAHEAEAQPGADETGLKTQEKIDRSSMTIRMDLSDLAE